MGGESHASNAVTQVSDALGGSGFSCFLDQLVVRDWSAGLVVRQLEEGVATDAGTGVSCEKARNVLSAVVQVAVFVGGFVVDKLVNFRTEVLCFDDYFSVGGPPCVEDRDQGAALGIGCFDLGYALDRVAHAEREQWVAAPFRPDLVAAERHAAFGLGLTAPAPDGERGRQQIGTLGEDAIE